MPTTCYVPGCRSGYDRQSKEKRSFFSPPKDPIVFSKWSKAIARQDLPLSDKSRVCDLHFSNELIQKYDSFVINGEKVEIPRQRYKLHPTAVPHIFPNLPKYLSRNIEVKSSPYQRQSTKSDVPSTRDNCILDSPSISPVGSSAGDKSKVSADSRRKIILKKRIKHFRRKVALVSRRKEKKKNAELERELHEIKSPSNKQVHFDENQFESHRLDGQRKLKPFGVPSIFNTSGPNDGQNNVECLEQHEPEITFHKQIKIESVISLRNVARTLSAASNVTQKKKAGRPRSSKKKSIIQQRRTSARISVRGRRKWTHFYKEEYEINTQSKKIQNKLRRTCPKEVRVVIEKIPRRRVQSSSGKGPPKEKISQHTVQTPSEKGPPKERIPRRSVQSTLEKGTSKEGIPRRSVQSTLEKGTSKDRIPRRSVQSTLEKGTSQQRTPRRSVQSTSEKGPSKERLSQRTVRSTLKRGPSKRRVLRRSVQSTSEEGPSKDRTPRLSVQRTSGEVPCEDRIPQTPIQSTLEEDPSKERILQTTVQTTLKETPSKETESSNMPSKKRSRGSVGTRPRPRKILRLDDENDETQVSCGLESSQDDAAEGEKVSGNCVVCNNYVEQGTMLDTLSNVSKEHFYEKLNRLVTGQDTITVKKDGVLCSVCTRLLNYMDRIEVELSMLKTALVNCMRKKRVLKQDPNSSGQNQHEISDSNNKIHVPPPVNLEHTEEDREQKDTSNGTLPSDGEHIGDSDDHVGINNPKPLNQAKCDRSEQPDLSNDAAINEESKTKTNVNELKCRICTFKTCLKSVMIFHLRQHVKEKFRCDFCNLIIPEDSEHIKHMLALPPYLRHRKKVIRLPEDFKPEWPISNANSGLVVKRDLSSDIVNINSEALSDNVVKGDISDCKASSLRETNVKLFGNGNIGRTVSGGVKVQENMSIQKHKRTVVKKIICKTNKNLVKHGLKCQLPEAK